MKSVVLFCIIDFWLTNDITKYLITANQNSRSQIPRYIEFPLYAAREVAWFSNLNESVPSSLHTIVIWMCTKNTFCFGRTFCTKNEQAHLEIERVVLQKVLPRWCHRTDFPKSWISMTWEAGMNSTLHLYKQWIYKLCKSTDSGFKLWSPTVH